MTTCFRLKRRELYCVFYIAVSIAFCVHALGQNTSADPISRLDQCNVVWHEPGPTSSQSMPLGNGDLGLNVWSETNGDVCFYIGKSDAWNEDVRGSEGLMKIGGVRVSLVSSALATGSNFSQTLKLHEGAVEIIEGAGANAVNFRIWADANNPVIRVQVSSGKPVIVKAGLIDWRNSRSNPDVILTNDANSIMWYHHNRTNADLHVAGLTFGAVIKGGEMVKVDATNLASINPVTSQLISVYPLTARPANAAQWQAQLESRVAEIDKLDLDQTWAVHRRWWDEFWKRSWIFVQGDDDATRVNEGYTLQRFVTACAGRGAYPIKFNGSLFVVDDPALPQGKDRPSRAVTADYRTWGGQYWFQNTRAMYWPRLAAGDFDMMQPLFKMYAGQLASNAVQVAGYYHHEGAYFAETAPYWGGLSYWGPEVKENWTGHYFTPILELSMMMLDYFEFTGDKQFVRETLVPVVSSGLTFFDRHFKRDEQGKLWLDPDNAIETFWKVHNPAPDIAGLRAVLSRMIDLPDDLVSQTARTNWQRFLREIPDLPLGMTNGRSVLLPYAGPQTAKFRNTENPELYAVYPFRLYGLGRPELALAVDTFKVRRMRGMGCWSQDPVQAALLGQTEVARRYLTFNLTNREPRLKFPAFWAKSHDYAPDEDNGGNAERALQLMLMQTDGKKILLLPAWPKGWNAEFKLHAPYNTTVESKVRNGRLQNLKVTPPERLADVVDCSVSSDANK